MGDSREIKSRCTRRDEEGAESCGGSEDEMIKNLIRRVGMKRERQANRTLNNV